MITSGKATLVELKEKLSLEEEYQILEAVYVANHNENVLQKEAIEKAEMESSRSA